MVNAFCPKCGKPQETGKLCTECTKKEVGSGYIPPLIQVSEFNRMFHKGVWRRFNDIDDIIVSRVQEALGLTVPIDIPAFEFTPSPKQKTKFVVTAHIEGEEVPLEVKLSYMQCDFGQKQKTEYYEGIMQLREPQDAVFAFIDKEMLQLAPKGVFITKTAEQKNGVDLYFTNKTHMHLLGQKIASRFGATITMHPQLFSHNHQTSKDIYRLNILVTLPKFSAGDVIAFDYPRKGRLLVYVSSMGKITQGTNLLLKKHIGFELKNCDDIEVFPKQKSTVSSLLPELGVLDPQTYQEESAYNASKTDVVVGQEVSVVKTPHGLYIVD